MILALRCLVRKDPAQRGFTLVELAIVLGVAGLMFAGLWRLLANSGQQLRDQSAADQQTQLVSAVKSYMASAEGQSLLTATAANGTLAISLPTSNSNAANCTANIAANPGLCNYLSPGFTNGTTNAYGQTYSINVLKDSTAAGTAANSYSFMILTSGGDTIPDTSGGRIASLIGGDGGFVYSQSAVCAANLAAQLTTACGSYGGWTQALATYNFNANSGGHVASRSFVAIDQLSSSSWLARSQIDNAAPPVFNTMLTTMYFKSGAAISLNMQGNAINVAGGTISLAGGIIDGGGGSSGATNFNTITGTNLSVTTATATSLDSKSITANAASKLSTAMNVNSASCTKADTSDATCAYALQVTGDETVTGLINANNLYASGFIYGQSGGASDIRLKSDIYTLHDTLADIMKIRPVHYMLKINHHYDMGVIAQEIEKIYPELILGSNKYKAVNYNGLIAPLIGAVQELKTQNDDLRLQIKQQQDKIDNLVDRLEKLEK